MDAPASPPVRVAFRWVGLFHGVLLFVSATGVAVAGMFTLRHVQVVAREFEEVDAAIPPLVRAFLEHPGLVLCLAIPAALCGLAVVLLRRHHLVILTLGFALLILGVALVLFSFLSVLQPLYNL